MSRGPQVNPPGRHAIVEALFEMMNQKPFSEITVTDIIEQAHVARATYYRNFYSKEDIIRYFLEIMQSELMKELPSSKMDAMDIEQFLEPKLMERTLELSFKYCLKSKFYLMSLQRNGLGSVIQETLAVFAGNVTIESNSQQRYRMLFLQGALYSVIVQWLSNGAVESPHAMAHIVMEYFQNGITGTQHNKHMM